MESSSDSGDSIPGDDTWIEEKEAIKRLFSGEYVFSADEVFSKAKEQTGFDFYAYKRKHGLNMYDCIKVINYIRKRVQGDNSKEPITSFSIDNTDWKDDKYLKTSLPGDPLLYSIDADDENDFESIESAKTEEKEPELPEKTKTYIAFLEKQVMDASAIIKNAMSTDNEVITSKELKENEAKTHARNEASYFGAYDSFDIHRDMLDDKARTESYRDFMYQNKHIFKDKVVMDLGCGTGILSMFAAKAGAKRVIAVDRSTIIHRAKEIVAENDLQDKIHFVHGNIEKIDEISVGTEKIEKVDLIVSEWMGYCLLFEGMLTSLLVARDRWVKKGGSVYPDMACMDIAGFQEDTVYQKNISFWKDVYGFKMSTIGNHIKRNALVRTLVPDNLLSKLDRFKVFNLNEMEQTDVEFKSDFKLTFTKDGTFHGFVVSFANEFTHGCNNKVILDTSSLSVPTHWEQTLFFLDEPITVKKDTIMTGSFDCFQDRKYHRDLSITISYTYNSKSNSKKFILT